MITIYGSSKSRASRSILALEELGLEYVHVPLNPHASAEQRAQLDALNPNRHAPVIDDDGLIVWESMAINLYLGDRYGRPPLWPATPRERAIVYQWSVWSQTEVDRPDFAAVRRSGDPERIAATRAIKVKALAVLDGALRDRAYLLGGEFSLADLNVAATLSEPHEGGKIDWERLDPFALGLPKLGDWLARCTSRASWRKVAAFP